MAWKSFLAAAAMATLLVAPVAAMAQDQDNANQVQIITVMPLPERDYGMTLYKVIPVSDQPGFITWLSGFTPEQQILVIRDLHAYSLGGSNVVMFTDTTTPDVAMPVFVNVLEPTDQTTFTTFWNGLTPAQQTSYITYARDVYPTSTTTTTTTQTYNTTPTSTVGASAQAFGNLAFSTFLPATVAATFESMAPDLPGAELGGMEHFLMMFTPDQAAMMVPAFAALNNIGKSGQKESLKGITDSDARALFLTQFTGDKSAFETMWSGMNDDQKTCFLQLVRDAYNGGFNDLGSVTTTSGG